MKTTFWIFISSVALIALSRGQVAQCFGDNEQFVFIGDVLTQPEAKAACVALGGTLARVGSIEEVDIIKSITNIVTSRPVPTWIGIEDLTNSQVAGTERFSFVDGNVADLDFIHVDDGAVPWGSNFPSATGGGCVISSTSQDRNIFSNVACSSRGRFVCRTACPSSGTETPTNNPTSSLTQNPTKRPTSSPTKSPTFSPTKRPTSNPTSSPSFRPTTSPIASRSSESASTTALAIGVSSGLLVVVGIVAMVALSRRQKNSEKRAKEVALMTGGKIL